MKQFDADEFLKQMAASLDLSYDDLVKLSPFIPPLVTARMLRLGRSPDWRKQKRAWRIYQDVNGRSAPHSYFSALIAQERRRRAMTILASAIYPQMLEQARIEANN